VPEIAVILPTLNERENLAPMIARIDAALAGLDWEAIVVDDDSPDGTADEARTLARTNRRVSVIHRVGRRGLASAVIEGVCATAAPVVAVMDADHQHDPALIPPMLEKLRAGEADAAPGPCDQSNLLVHSTIPFLIVARRAVTENLIYKIAQG